MNVQNFCGSPQNVCMISLPSARVLGLEYAKKNKGTFYGLAITQLVLGVCCIGLGIASLAVCSETRGCSDPYYGDWEYYYYGVWTRMGTNVWGGALVVVFASFGLAQACRPSTCTIGTNLVLSVFGILCTLNFFGLEITAACTSYHSDALVVLHSIASFFFFVSLILFIVNTSYAGVARGCCCKGCCCGEELEAVNAVQYMNPSVSGQIVTFPNGQTYVIQGQINPTIGQPMLQNGVPFQVTPPGYEAAYNPPRPHEIPVQHPPGPSGTSNVAYRSDIPTKM